jgi:leucyl-tRNA synthetase
VLLIAPFAPFIYEELWEKLGQTGSVHVQTYPQHDPALAADEVIVYPVCINGKKRAEAPFDVNTGAAEIQKIVLQMEAVRKWLDGQTVKKVIIVPGRMINIVV